jgi:hypothetical protein
MALYKQKSNNVIKKRLLESMNSGDQDISKKISDLIFKHNLLDFDIITDDELDNFFEEADIILKDCNEKKFAKIKQEIRKRKLNKL